MADVIYNSFRAALGGDAAVTGSPIDLEGDDIRILLCTATYTPSAAHVYRSEITGEVAAGGGYSTAGQALAGESLSYSGATATFDATDAVWSASTITARYAILYKYNAGVAANEPLICCLDFGSDKSSSNGDFTVQFNASGILTIT